MGHLVVYTEFNEVAPAHPCLPVYLPLAWQARYRGVFETD